MTLFEKNLKFLIDTFPHFSTCVKDITHPAKTPVLTGAPRPNTDFKRLNLSAKNYICAGFGNFEFLNYLKSEKSTAHIIIFEASKEAFSYALNRFDFSNEFSGLSVAILPIPIPQDLEMLYPIFDEVIQGGYKAILETQDRNSRKKNEVVLQEILTILTQRKADYVLSSELEEEITKNTIYNIPEILNGHALYAFKNCLGNRPLIIVAPGPSLENAKKYNNVLFQRCHTLVIDTAIPSCHQLGICPTWIVSVDQSSKNLIHFRGFNEFISKSILICDPGVYFEIPRQTIDHVVFYSSGKPLIRWIEKRTELLGFVRPGISSIISAVQCAEFLTQGPIILAGVDLCYQDDVFYAAGARKPNVKFEFQEGQLYKTITQGPPQKKIKLEKMQSVSGQMVWTDSLFLQVRNRLEWILGKSKNQWFSISDGLPIRGVCIDDISKLNLQSPPGTNFNYEPKTKKERDQNIFKDLNAILQDLSLISKKKIDVFKGEKKASWTQFLDQLFLELKTGCRNEISAELVLMMIIGKLFLKFEDTDTSANNKMCQTMSRNSARKLSIWIAELMSRNF